MDDLDQDNQDNQDVAQLLGFSSFGAQDPPHKKRRYNPQADAVTNTTNPTTITGANDVPIGEKSVMPTAADPEATHTLLPRAASSLPQRPPPTTAQQQQQQQGQNRQPAGVRGGRHTQGHGHGSKFDGYFDPLSIQNPWTRLEKARGVEARSSWPVPGDS